MTQQNTPGASPNAASQVTKPGNPQNPFEGATLNSAQLAKEAALKPAEDSKETPVVDKSNTEEAQAGGKSYQFPSAPTTYEFHSVGDYTGRRTTVPDGVLTVTDPEEIKQLDKAVKAGIIYPHTGEKTTLTDQQVPPKPVSPNQLN